MKILFLVSYYTPYHSGVTEYVRRIAEGLAERKHEVTVLTSQHDKSLPLEEKINGVNVKRLPVLFKVSKGVFKPTLLPTLWKISKEFDVINIHVPLPEVGFCTLASRNKNIILTYHCDLELHHSLLEKLIEKVYYLSLKLAIPKAKKIIVNDMDYALNSKIKQARGKIVEITPPIPNYSRKDPTKFKQKHGIKPDEKVVGFLGRLVYEKGLEYLIKAIPHVLEKQPNTRFIIAGEGEEIAGGRKHSVKENLIQLATQLKIKDKILFPGFIPEKEKEEYYSTCDVFVLPSIAALESYGMVQAEAMLCNTPVIATNRPGVKTPIQKTKMGLIIPPKDEKKLAEAILETLKNKDKYAIANSNATKEFSAENTTKEYEKTFLKTRG
jgi:glycosyltransferase involved in cell wall biosynthesis